MNERMTDVFFSDNPGYGVGKLDVCPVFGDIPTIPRLAEHMAEMDRGRSSAASSSRDVSLPHTPEDALSPREVRNSAYDTAKYCSTG